MKSGLTNTPKFGKMIDMPKMCMASCLSLLPRAKVKQLIELNEKIEKRQHIRKKEDCIEQIYNLLKMSDRPLNTSDISRKVKLSHRSTKRHLEFLEFDGRVKHFERGSVWLYWKVVR